MLARYLFLLFSCSISVLCQSAVYSLFVLETDGDVNSSAVETFLTSPTNSPSTTIGQFFGASAVPVAMVTAPQSRLVYAILTNGTVVSFSYDGPTTAFTVIGSLALIGSEAATAMTISSDERTLYVTTYDTTDSRVYKVTLYPFSKTLLGLGSLRQINGITAAQGALYMTDVANNLIVSMSINGGTISAFLSLAPADPTAITTSPNNTTLFVAVDDSGTGKAYAINLAVPTPIKIADLGTLFLGITASPDGSQVFVTNKTSSTTAQVLSYISTGSAPLAPSLIATVSTDLLSSISISSPYNLLAPTSSSFLARSITVAQGTYPYNHLSWAPPPSNSLTPTGYEIIRNDGKRICLGPTVTYYYDANAPEGSTYEIRSLAGNLKSDPAIVIQGTE